MRCCDSSNNCVEVSPSSMALKNVLRRYCNGSADVLLKCHTALALLMSGLLSEEVEREYGEFVRRECPSDLIEALKYELATNKSRSQR